jgi:hypothetical protein
MQESVRLAEASYATARCFGFGRILNKHSNSSSAPGQGCDLILP